MNYGPIRQILNVSNKLRDSCYYIANAVCDNPEEIYETIQADVKSGGILFVYGENDNLYGFIKGRLKPMAGPRNFEDMVSARIDWLYVYHKNYRPGIGASLLAAYADHMKSLGAQCLYTRVPQTDHALEFWREKNKFRPAGNNLMVKVL